MIALPPIPADPEERSALAAEYVLGTLEARMAAAIRQAMASDAGLAAEVAAWETRLAPLTTLAPPEAPPPGLWPRIEAALPGMASARAPAQTSARRGWRDPWRFGAFASGLVAAGLAAFIVFRPAPEPRLMTVLLTSRDQPAWVVEAAGDSIRLASLNARPVEVDRVMQLWALPPGATAPTSLGLMPAEGSMTVTPGGIRPQPGMLIEVSLEPTGGSPTGRPTGPVLFIGRLAPAVGS